MSEAWVPLGLMAVAVAATGAYLLSGRRKKPTVVAADTREERLARRVAGMVGCTPGQALPAVTREIDIAPRQSDETLIKRAAYHYRQELPEKECPVYRDGVRG